MPLETLFKAANYAVLPFWILLLAAPRWRWTHRLVHGPFVVLLLTPIYAFLLFGYAPPPDGMTFLTLYGVMIGFSSPHLVLAGWIHYLVFDLFVGAWETRDALRRGVPRWLLVPSLLTTLLFGPIGLLFYLVARFFTTGVLEYEETAES